MICYVQLCLNFESILYLSLYFSGVHRDQYMGDKVSYYLQMLV